MMIGIGNERRPYPDDDESASDGGASVAIDPRDARVTTRGTDVTTTPYDIALERNLTMLDADTAAGCKRYYHAIAARDLEAVLDAMTPAYGRHLSEMRSLPDFGAFFLLWCECQGHLVSVISSSVRGDSATVAIETDKAVAFAKLRRIAGRWLVDSEQVGQVRKLQPFQRMKIDHSR